MIIIRKSNCQLCGYFCGVLVHVDEKDRILKIVPDPARYPYDASIIGACRRFPNIREIVDHPQRMNYPLRRKGKRGANEWERISWDDAIYEISDKLINLKNRFGPETLSTSISAPHSIYWPMHRFLNIWGSPNNVGIGIVCWNPAIWVNSLTFGWPVDDELDLNKTKCVLVWGKNPAESDRSLFWHTLKQFSHAGGKLIVIDPLRTKTAQLTDDWVSIKPGTDGALALGILHYIIKEKLYDRKFVKNWSVGFDDLYRSAEDYPLKKVADITGVPVNAISEIARVFAVSKPASIFTGLGIDHSGVNCTQTHRSIAILKAITGNIDIPGGSGLNDTSDFTPEVDLELGHMLSEEQRRKQLGQSIFPLLSYGGFDKLSKWTMRHGKKLPMRYMTSTHPELVWNAMITGSPYPVRAMICMASNPLLTQANTNVVHKALTGLDLLVSLEHFMTPTAMLSDYILPITGSLEQSIVQINGGVANVAYGGGAAIRPRHERRTDFDFWNMLAKRCGQGEFWQWDSFENALNDIFSSTNQTWETFCEKGLYAPERSYNKYLEKGFATPSGKVEIKSCILEETGNPSVPGYIENCTNNDFFPLTLITGARKHPYYSSEFRQIDRIRNKQPLPVAEMSSVTASKFGLKEGDTILIETTHGKISQTLAFIEMVEDVVSIEYGWWYPEQKTFSSSPGGLFESNANVLTSSNIENCDSALGQWNLRSIPCRVCKSDKPLSFTRVRKAGPEDKEALLRLLSEVELGYTDPIEDYWVAVTDNELSGCIRVEIIEEQLLIRPIAVSENYRRKGVGQRLLNHICTNDKSILVAARGDATSFYKALGFLSASWDIMPEVQTDECKACPDKDKCNPRPMILNNIYHKSFDERE